MGKKALSLTLGLCLTGCSSLLPESRTDTTPFESFEQAQHAVMGLEPMKSVQADLAQNGFTLTKHPNLTVLNHADVVRRFLGASVMRREDVDPGILRCVEAREDCHGIEVVGAKIHRARRGGFWADFLNFERRTETKGWRFSAVVLMVKEVVVYRNWSGQPAIDQVEVSRNPLGPFQDIGPPTVTSATGPH